MALPRVQEPGDEEALSNLGEKEDPKWKWVRRDRTTRAKDSFASIVSNDKLEPDSCAK